MGKKKAAVQAPSTAALVGQTVDVGKASYRIGALIGKGGFGAIHLASKSGSAASAAKATYVMKIEHADSGGLFSEMKCLQNMQLVEWKDAAKAWKSARKLKHLGLPNMVACGPTQKGKTELRAMVLDRLGPSLQSDVDASRGGKFSVAEVLPWARDVLTALEFCHHAGYAHADVKSANLCRGLRDPNHIYLIDFGIAVPFRDRGGQHRVYAEDPRKAHDGTLEFTSCDAHKGVPPSRRTDVEILGYVMLQWVAELPWKHLCAPIKTPHTLKTCQKVQEAKMKYNKGRAGKGMTAKAAAASAKELVEDSTAGRAVPGKEILAEFIASVLGLGYTDAPSYPKLGAILSRKAPAAKPAGPRKRAGKGKGKPVAVESDEELEEEEEEIVRPLPSRRRPPTKRKPPVQITPPVAKFAARTGSLAGVSPREQRLQRRHNRLLRKLSTSTGT